jgi:multimeric flavodoxin WrbA
MFYSNGAAFAGKPAAAVAVCRRGGATAAFQSLNMPFQMMNMPVVTSQYWNIVYGMAPGDAALDAEGLQTMRTLANNMAALLKATGGTPMPGPTEPRQGMNFIR